MQHRLVRALGAGAVIALGIAAYLLIVSRTGPDHVTVVPWPKTIAHPGGWSGLEVSADGTRFWAVHDNGGWARGHLDRASSGEPKAATLDALGPLLDGRGYPLVPPFQDSEGLTLDSEGRFAVSFEWQHRVWRYNTLEGPAVELRPARRFAGWGGNSGPEALAVDRLGGLITFRERSTTLHAPEQTYRYLGGRWRPGPAFPPGRHWSAVGADIGPDGLLYILERRFRFLGFANRIRRMDLTAPDPAATVETLFHTPLGRYGNLEGLGLWQDPKGRLRALMVSDNNLMFFQREHLVEVILPLAAP